MSLALLSIAILLAAAWVINNQVVAQARQQVEEEVKASFPLYEAVWEEQGRQLSTLGAAMAGSPIVKTILGDDRASQDNETIRQMLGEFGQDISRNVDLILIADGAGHIKFAESHGSAFPQIQELPQTRAVAAEQNQAQSFALLGGRLFHLVLTPVLSHSRSVKFNDTLAVLVAGSELNRKVAYELKRRAHSDVLFFAGDRLYASSLPPEEEVQAADTAAVTEIAHLTPDQPAELKIAGETQLGFARPLAAFDGRPVGKLVVLHSLAASGRLFHAISNKLILLGSSSIVLALLISYLIARRVTQPIESLVVGAQEFGRGNYDYHIDLSPGGEVGQLAHAFDQMRCSIRQGQAELIRRERLATVGQMASSIIHDLRSPLAAISTAADLFAGVDVSPERRHVLAQNQLRASQRMAQMLKELLDFSRGKYALKLQRRALAPLIDSVAQELIASEMAPGIAIELDISPEFVVQVDGERAQRMFENILMNSIQAMGEGGKITIRAATDADRIKIYIADTGPGVPEQIRHRLFEPFVSHDKQAGTGLGLAIARSIAEAHGGSLTLVSPVGQPAQFRMELPLL